jgi:hypothetical protein
MNLNRLTILSWWLTVALALPVHATSYIPRPLDDLRALSQAADIVVIARIVDFKQGHPTQISPDGFYTKGESETFHCEVLRTVAGSIAIKGEQSFAFEGGDYFRWTVTDDPYLLFIRRLGVGYQLCGSPIKMKNDQLQVWFEGKPFGSYYNLRELMPLIRQNQEMKVAFTGSVPEELLISKNVLSTTWTFKNIGSHPVRILRPSSCFNSLLSRRLRNGGWNPKTDPWQSVDHCDFLHQSEEPIQLLPGREFTLRYEIPLDVLKMRENGEYEITFYYHQDQLSHHHRWGKMGGRELCEIWRGEPVRSTFVVHVR